MPGKVFEEQVVTVRRPWGWEGPWRKSLVVRRYMLFIQCDCPDSTVTTIFRGEEKEAALRLYLQQARAGFPVEPGTCWWTTVRTRNDMRVETFNKACLFWWSIEPGSRFPQRELLFLEDRYARYRHTYGICRLIDWEHISMAEAHSLIAEHGWVSREPVWQ
jgi:hypothetical protein